jgi:hypothetical protein
MKKLIKRVVVDQNKFNPYGIKMFLRDTARDKFKGLYFKPTSIIVNYDGDEKPLHIGGMLFGMPDKWKGIYGQVLTPVINEDGEVSEIAVDINLETMRISEETADWQACKELLEKVLKEVNFV